MPQTDVGIASLLQDPNGSIQCNLAVFTQTTCFIVKLNLCT